MQHEVRQVRRSPAQQRRTREQQIQTRRFALAVSILALIVVITAVGSYSSRAEAAPEPGTPSTDESSVTAVDPALTLVSATYTAELTGDFGADGPKAQLVLHYDDEVQTVSYALEVTSPLTGPSTAALCLGSPGQDGSTVFNMFEGPTIAGKFSGMLVQGEIAASDLVGPLQGSRITDLVLMLEDGGVYATIGTAGAPAGAIRGQVE